MWDKYFLEIAEVVARNSKCCSIKIGAVLVKDKSIISTGYNGPPRGVPPCDERHKVDKSFLSLYEGHNTMPKEGVCPRRAFGYKSGEGLHLCVAGHAERNALINAAREGIKTYGTKLYLTCGVPCTPCLVEIINAGVEEVICTSMVLYDASARYLMNYVKIRKYEC